MRSAAGLQLGEQVADVRLDGLLGEEEPLADLPVHEAVRDQLKHLDLAHGRLLLELAERRAERDHLGARIPAVAPGRHLVEAAGVIQVSAQDVLALCGVHVRGDRQASLWTTPQKEGASQLAGQATRRMRRLTSQGGSATATAATASSPNAASCGTKIADTSRTT